MVGALSLRTRGFFFLMVTLAFGQMMFFLFHDTKLGGGTDGAFLARPVLSLFDWQMPLTRRQRPLAVYYVALVLLSAMYLGLVLLLRSLFGRVLEGIRVNEHRMQALGFNTYRYKLAAFVIAGMLAGVAGHMWAMHRGFVNPELIGWHRSAEALLMILLGGLATPARPHHRRAGLHRRSARCAQHRDRAQAAGGGPRSSCWSCLALPKGLSGIARCRALRRRAAASDPAAAVAAEAPPPWLTARPPGQPCSPRTG